MDYEEHIRVLSYDTLSEEINGLRIEISELKNKEFDLECEVKRLRGIIDYIRDTGRMERTYGPLLSIMEKVLTTEEYLEWRDEE